jgi:hypothetical protein
MIDKLEIICGAFLKSWAMWGMLAMVIIPIGFAVVALWDFSDWLKYGNRKDRDDHE